MNIIYKKVKDFAVVYSGTTPSTSTSEFWSGNIKWLTPAELKDGHNWYIYDTERKITEIAVQKKNLRLLKAGTVLLTSRAPIGKVALVGEPMCTNQGFKNIECDTEIMNPEFLYFWLLGKKEYLNSLGRGATFKEISKTIVENILVPVPTLDIQNRIVSALKKSLILIDKREIQIEALDQLTQSVFLEMFGDPVKNKNKYNIDKLSDLCLKITDGTHHSPPMVNKGIPYVTAKHLSSGYLDFYSNPTYISLEDHQKIYERCNPEKGDVLYIKDGATTGIAGINHYDFEFSILSSLALIKVIPSKLNNYYLVYYLNHKGIHNKITSNMSGGAIKRLTIKKINDINVVVPPIHLQDKFAELIIKVEQQKTLLTEGLTELQNNYNSIMQRAFKGELFNEEKVSNF